MAKESKMEDIDFDTLKTLNILYVEDEEEIREEMILNTKDFFNEFIVGSDGKDGLEKFEQNSIDLIITDIQMPKLNGLEMIEEIRKSSDIPIIITTAFTEIAYLQKSIKLKVDGYISKPINLKELLRTVSKASIKIVNERLRKSLEEMNKNLEKKVAEKVDELRQKDKIMLQQSKYAMMGEIIDAVAHQWRQPLTSIDMLAFAISKEFKRKINEKYCDDISINIKSQIKHLNSTLDEFRNFFRVDKKIDIFTIKEAIESVLVLVKDEYRNERINVTLEGDIDIKIEGYLNEFKHVILNIINNSKDAFIENCLKDRKIKIEVTSIDKKAIISISDNAGGIKEEVLPKIFQPNFTTKEKKGTGIGLYIIKTIIDKIAGKIEVENIEMENGDKKDRGVKFKIIVNKFEN